MAGHQLLKFFSWLHSCRWFSASEAEPTLGFMARLLTLCSLPRTNPGDRLQYKRVNGPYTLIMTATGEYKLPFGPLPRLLMAWLSTEAIAPWNGVLNVQRFNVDRGPGESG